MEICFSQILNLWYLEISVTIVLKQLNKSINFDLDQQHYSQNTRFPLPQHIDHWKIAQYWGLADRGVVDLDSDVNYLASRNIRESTTVPSQCEQLT